MGIKFNVIRTFVKSLTKQKPTVSIKAKETSKPFCEQYWNALREKGLISQTNKESVSLHGHLNGINHHFINSPNPKSMDEVFFFTKLTPRQMITKTDIEFKRLKPTEEPLKVYRAIGKKPEFFSEYPLYQKRLNIKKGDIIDMKEYSYATSDFSYASVYMTNNQGIMYEINIPKGSGISRVGAGFNNEIVFPRSSKFKCTGTEKIKDDKNDYLLVKLEYLI